MSSSPRIVFMGSPEFALPTLRALADSYRVVGVVTQPDKPAGRGRTLTPPPVKVLAQELDLPVIQPRRLRDPEAMERLETWQPDIVVVAAFGQILRPSVLDLAPFGCVNVHASLLPRWRGAAPIQAAILHGDEQTGVTIMRMDTGIDTGPILSQRTLAILNDDTAETLSRRLSDLGAGLLLETLPPYVRGELAPQPQEDAQATYTPMLKKEAGRLDFQLPAVTLERQVRAFHPWPGAYIEWQGGTLKILRASAVDGNGTGSSPSESTFARLDLPTGAGPAAAPLLPHSPPQASAPQASALQPGERIIYQGFPAIGATTGILLLEEVQPAGKRPMAGKVFLQGARGWV